MKAAGVPSVSKIFISSDRAFKLIKLTFISNDSAFVKKNGLHRAFIRGSNSTHRVHACSHWPIYEERCKAEDIKLHLHAMSKEVWRAIEQGKAGQKQQTLEGVSFALNDANWARVADAEAILAVSNILSVFFTLY